MKVFLPTDIQVRLDLMVQNLFLSESSMNIDMLWPLFLDEFDCSTFQIHMLFEYK